MNFSGTPFFSFTFTVFISVLALICGKPAHAAIGNHRSYSCAAAIELALVDWRIKGQQVRSGSQLAANSFPVFFKQRLGLNEDGPQRLINPVSVNSSESPSSEIVEATRARARAVNVLLSTQDENVKKTAIGFTDPHAIAAVLNSWAAASGTYNERDKPSNDATLDSVKLIMTMAAALPTAGVGVASGNPYLIGASMFLAARVARSTTKGMDFRSLRRIEKLQSVLKQSQVAWSYFGETIWTNADDFTEIAQEIRLLETEPKYVSRGTLGAVTARSMNTHLVPRLDSKEFAFFALDIVIQRYSPDQIELILVVHHSSKGYTPGSGRKERLELSKIVPNWVPGFGDAESIP